MTTPDDPFARPDQPAQPPAPQQPAPPAAGGYPPPPPGPGGHPPAPPAGGGYPPAPPGGPYPYGQPPRPAGTNGLAIASLVTSLVGIVTCGLAAVVGLVLGIVSLSQIKKTGQDGKGMAIAGIAVGGVIAAIALIVVLLLVVFAEEADDLFTEIDRCNNGYYTGDDYQEKCVDKGYV